MTPTAATSFQSGYRHWLEENYPDDRRCRELAVRIKDLRHRPVISVIMPVYLPEACLLECAIRSLLGQVLPDWELRVVVDADPNGILSTVLQRNGLDDARIFASCLPLAAGIAAATNAGLATARGEFVTFLDQDDVLAPNAIYEVVALLNRATDADLIYSDEDKLDEDGAHRDPSFKPDWCPDSLTSRMYIGKLAVYRRAFLESLGGLRSEYDGAQDYDLALRATERTTRIHHIAKVLYHWRQHPGSTAKWASAKPYAFGAAHRALADAFRRRGEGGVVQDVEGCPGHFVPRYPLKSWPTVSIVIPTRNCGSMLERCLRSIFERTRYEPFEVVLVNNGTDEQAALHVIRSWTRAERQRVRVVSDSSPFNFSRLCNLGARAARGELLLFLNNDVEMLHEEWLAVMVEQAVRASIGAVGATLVYPDGTVQHAGVVLGLGGTCAHSHRGQPADSLGYAARLKTVNNYLAVTGACLMCRRHVFDAVSGFDESLPGDYNDVDFCLRLREQGYYNVCLPHARLIHHESKTRGPSPGRLAALKEAEQELLRRWSKYVSHDPCYNPHLTRSDESFSVGDGDLARRSGLPVYDSRRRPWLRIARGSSFIVDEMMCPADASFMYIRGWCATRTGETPERLDILVNGLRLGAARLGDLRPDVVRALRFREGSAPGFVFALENLPTRALAGNVQVTFEAHFAMRVERFAVRLPC